MASLLRGLPTSHLVLSPFMNGRSSFLFVVFILVGVPNGVGVSSEVGFVGTLDLTEVEKMVMEELKWQEVPPHSNLLCQDLLEKLYTRGSTPMGKCPPHGPLFSFTTMYKVLTFSWAYAKLFFSGRSWQV